MALNSREHLNVALFSTKFAACGWSGIYTGISDYIMDYLNSIDIFLLHYYD